MYFSLWISRRKKSIMHGHEQSELPLQEWPSTVKDVAVKAVASFNNNNRDDTFSLNVLLTNNKKPWFMPMKFNFTPIAKVNLRGIRKPLASNSAHTNGCHAPQWRPNLEMSSQSCKHHEFMKRMWKRSVMNIRNLAGPRAWNRMAKKERRECGIKGKKDREGGKSWKGDDMRLPFYTLFPLNRFASSHSSIFNKSTKRTKSTQKGEDRKSMVFVINLGSAKYVLLTHISSRIKKERNNKKKKKEKKKEEKTKKFISTLDSQTKAMQF